MGSGYLKNKAKITKVKEELYHIMENCTLCPRDCRINRLKGEIGFCGVNGRPVISSYFAHFGEENVIKGTKGSGTIFLTGCNLKCVFCQNFRISQLMEGSETTIENIAGMMIELQDRGCHNINFVTPTHQIAFIIEALEIAIDKGLKLPLVYNTGGYDHLKIIKKLDGIFDIYLPDFKFFSSEIAKRYTAAPDYPENVKSIIKEMYKQVGPLKTKNNIAEKGFIIRHLIMPNAVKDSKKIMDWIKENIPKATVNIMGQYMPYFKARDYPEINRPLEREEYEEVLKYAKGIGINIL